MERSPKKIIQNLWKFEGNRLVYNSEIVKNIEFQKVILLYLK